MGTVLTSTVVAAIVAAAVAVWTTQRRISVENITQDRKAWREKVRERALFVHDAIIFRDKDSLNRLRAEFRAILNPCHDEDKAIVSCIALPEDGTELHRAEEFAQRIALLLKHDWERVKLEAGPLSLRAKGLRRLLNAMIYTPKRKNYHDQC